MKHELELVVTPPAGIDLAKLDALEDIRHAFASGPVDIQPGTQGAWWYRRAGVPVDGYLPAAAFREQSRATRQCFCADPVRLQVSGDAVVLDAGAAADLTRQDAEELVAVLNRHFGADGIAFRAIAPDQWLMESETPIEAITSAPEAAHARSIESYLPQGPQARRLKQIGNEAQMLFHDCPVNQAREARGQAPISGLWLWGGAREAAVAIGMAGTSVFSNRLHVRGLALSANAPAAPLPAGASALPERAEPSIIDLFAAFADPHEWPSWLADQWLAPLLQGGAQTRIILDVPGASASAPLFRGDPWRFLRRGSLASRLRGAGVDV